MMKTLRNVMRVCTLMILAACSHLHSPHSPENQWQAARDWQIFNASGRLGVKINEKGSYANFDWTRQDGVETIDINTPLGNTVGQLCQDAQGVLAVDNHNRLYTADNAAQLSEQLLGYVLPIEHLGVWANGEWVRDVPHSVDNFGRLKQLGWTITRQVNDDGLPRVLLLENSEMSIRLAFSDSERVAGLPENIGQCTARLEQK